MLITISLLTVTDIVLTLSPRGLSSSSSSPTKQDTILGGSCTPPTHCSIHHISTHLASRRLKTSTPPPPLPLCSTNLLLLDTPRLSYTAHPAQACTSSLSHLDLCIHLHVHVQCRNDPTNGDERITECAITCVPVMSIILTVSST